MQNIFTDYPTVPWKQGWRIASGPDETHPLLTDTHPGVLTDPDATWTLTLIPPAIPCDIRLLSNGLSIHARKRSHNKSLELLQIEPGVLLGKTEGFGPPKLSAEQGVNEEEHLSWVKQGEQTTLLLYKTPYIVLVTGSFPQELALLKAEEALEKPFQDLVEEETQHRRCTENLFSINPRHNPPVAIASESLRLRLRSRTAALHGLWSTSDGFEHDTFSLNELYPLVRAWNLVDPDIALQLIQTALSLQLGSGGFPSWVDVQGATSSSAPWPLIVQSFELVWLQKSDPVLLKRTLPSLRKYMQWAIRRFDPHRDQIPSWQSEQEIFIPGNFDRDKATPDLTVMILGELEALMRLSSEMDHSEATLQSLTVEHEQFNRTLTTIFWNPKTKAFSNVWKNGHFSHEPTFGSFLPLLLKDLALEFKTPLLEKFDETHGFPGKTSSSSWKHEEMDDTPHLPAIHQFMAFEALLSADKSRALLLLFVQRSRDGFAAWFERESIEAARRISHDESTDHPAFALGPVTAALILTTQQEFQQEVSSHASGFQNVLRWIYRARLNASDAKLLIGVGVLMLIIHLGYNIPRRHNIENQIAEAAINYKQGHFTETLKTCQRYPDSPLSQFLLANLMMLAENPSKAEELYHDALLQKTESPSALFGYALSLQMNGKFDDAVRRYNDFLDIHEIQLNKRASHPLVEQAYTFSRLAEAQFKNPPKWRQTYTLPIMTDLGL